MSPMVPRLRHRTDLTADPVTGAEYAVVRLAGELDLSAQPELDGLFTLCLALRPALVTVDLTRVTFLDSAGLGALETAAARIHAAGSAFALGGCPPSLVRRVLTLTAVPLGPWPSLAPHPVSRPPGRPPPAEPVTPGARWAVRGRVPEVLHAVMTVLASATVLGVLIESG
ncbi:STAS domain-containing protein [Streptomyces sp. NPDC003860]